MDKIASEVVTSYAAMRWWRDRFFQDDGPQTVIVTGRPGVSKSHMFREAMPGKALYQSGALSAFHLYMTLHEHADEPVVLDDVDSLFADKAAVNLLKCLCNTDAVRTVFWGKRSHELDEHGVPRRFQTTSRICILANTIKNVEANLGAVLDRAFVIRFEPSVHEVHREVGTWFGDREVHEFIGQHFSLIPAASMRWYVKASEMHRLGADWEGWLIRQWTQQDRLLATVAEVLADATITTAAQRVRRFKELSGGSRATYMRKQAEWRRLRGSGPVGASSARKKGRSQKHEILRPR